MSETAAPTPPPVEKDLPVTKDQSVETNQSISEESAVPPEVPQKEIQPAKSDGENNDHTMLDKEASETAASVQTDSQAAAGPETTATKIDGTTDTADVGSPST